jgi:hypothetical protein
MSTMSVSVTKNVTLPNVAYSTVPLAEAAFSARCALPPQQTIRVPQVKHIVHRVPVIQEHITEEVTYMEVPVSHYFEQRDYPQKVLAAVCPVGPQQQNKCGC